MWVIGVKAKLLRVSNSMFEAITSIQHIDVKAKQTHELRPEQRVVRDDQLIGFGHVGILDNGPLVERATSQDRKVLAFLILLNGYGTLDHIVCHNFFGKGGSHNVLVRLEDRVRCGEFVNLDTALCDGY